MVDTARSAFLFLPLYSLFVVYRCKRLKVGVRPSCLGFRRVFDIGGSPGSGIGIGYMARTCLLHLRQARVLRGRIGDLLDVTTNVMSLSSIYTVYVHHRNL